jgi:pheromone shutdown protein TraB
MQQTENEANPDQIQSSDVHRINLNGREIILVGTAHISRESANLVREVIEQEKPDSD